MAPDAFKGFKSFAVLRLEFTEFVDHHHIERPAFCKAFKQDKPNDIIAADDIHVCRCTKCPEPLFLSACDNGVRESFQVLPLFDLVRPCLFTYQLRGYNEGFLDLEGVEEVFE